MANGFLSIKVLHGTAYSFLLSVLSSLFSERLLFSERCCLLSLIHQLGGLLTKGLLLLLGNTSPNLCRAFLAAACSQTPLPARARQMRRPTRCGSSHGRCEEEARVVRRNNEGPRLRRNRHATGYALFPAAKCISGRPLNEARAGRD